MDPLAQAFQEYRDQPCEPCPTSEEIWEAVHCLGSIERRLEIIDHISQCSCCAEDWRIAQGFPQDLPLEFGAVPPSDLQAANEAPAQSSAKIVSLSAWKRVLAPVAALAAVLAVIYLPFGQEGGQPEPTVDGLELNGKTPVYRKADTGIAPLQLDFNHTQGFSWTASADPKATYTLTFFDADYRRIDVVRDLQGHELELSAELRAKLQEAGSFSWEVTTKLSNGHLHRSEPKTETMP